MSVGLHSVTAYAPGTPNPPGAATPVDLSCIVETVDVTHGRDDTDSQPIASSAKLSAILSPTDPLPADVDVGSLVVIDTQTTVAKRTRFVGRVTDLALGWDDAGRDTPDHGIADIQCIGLLADYGRRVVGDAPFPQELDGDRVSRVFAAGGLVLDPAYSDPGTVQILARDIDSQPALNVAQDAAASASGIVWETRDGLIRYADAMRRKGAAVALVLDACDVLVTPTWRRTTEGIINEVSIGYGVAPDGGEQPRYVADNPTSRGKFGRYGVSAETALATLADATQLGQMLLVRNGSPVWVMANLPIDTKNLDDARYDQLLALDVHSLIQLTGLPAVGTAPTSASLWVEGWRESLGWGVHDIELVVSGYCRTTPAPRWDDVDPAWTWGGTQLTETRRNRMTYPLGPVATATAGWFPSRGTLSIVGDAMRLTITDATAGAMSQRVNTATPPTSNMPVKPNTVYTLTCEMRGTMAAPGALWAYTYDAALTIGAPNKAPPLSLDPAVFRRITLTFTTPANAAWLYPYIGIEAGTRNVGEWFEVRRVLLEESPTAGTFFDGDTADTTSTDYAWADSPRASASVQSAISTIGTGLPPTLTWDDSTCLGPPINVGRWNDQPATLRWDQVPPASTWDTYTGLGV